jgi:hypothetical protein|tara:strand:- start:3796 stop:4653 length:858 start_codon:yes stop_codon:yes gene_type:complete
MKKLIIPESELTNIIQKAVGKKLIEQDFTVEPKIGKTPRESELENVFGKYSGTIPADIVRYMRKNPKIVINRLMDIYGPKMLEYMTDMVIDDETEPINEGSADENKDGVISPDELYRHFDLDSDGVVTMEDYAAHVDFHCENPELLQPYRETEEYISKMGDERQPFVDFFMSDNLVSEQINDDEDYDDEDESEEFIKYPVDDFDFNMDYSDINDIYDHKGPLRRFRGSIYVDDMVPETDDKEYDRAVAKKMLEFYRGQIKNQETYVGGVGFKQRSLLDPYDNMDF